MNKYIWLFTGLFFYFTGSAQNTDINKEILALQMNSSPAYVVIGVEPENIQRPNSPTDFAASVQSAVVNGKMQPNFAMESTPYYWFKSRNAENYKAVDYIFNENYGDNLLRSITFSLATSVSDSLTFAGLKPGTALGIGLHLQLVQGKPSYKTIEKLTAWYQAVNGGIILAQMIHSLEQTPTDLDILFDNITSVGSLKDVPRVQIGIIKKFLQIKLNKTQISSLDIPKLQLIINELDAKSAEVLTAVNKHKFPLTKEGFMLEVSAANASVAQESKWDDLSSTKTAIWLTPSYRFNVNNDKNFANFIDLMAVARITINSKKIDSANYIDMGGKLQWIHNRFSLSGEIVSRVLTKKPELVRKKYTLRTAVSLSYKINEFITFQTTFGSNFDGNSTVYSDPSKMFAVGGFNFGFGNLFGTNTN